MAGDLVVHVVPKCDDEITCYSCFLMRHRSQWQGRKTIRPTALSVRTESRSL
ncbi:DUF4193 family protein [Arthrobacter globiformis]|uniref:DUF4193 family protein n=1 Tax=Arthrobacter globiformis TaxID=1665 RepID=UPI00397DE624